MAAASDMTASMSAKGITNTAEDYDGGIGLWPDGFAGVSKDGVFGAVASWVDVRLEPGCTPQTEQLGLRKTLRTIATLRHMFMSPNLVWFGIALALYALAPYDIAAAQEHGFDLSPGGWIAHRLYLNAAVAFAYYGFFFAGLYLVPHLTGASRKFRPGSYPTAGNMLHNLWYWALGIVQWTWWEALMVRLWATGAVQYATFEQLAAQPSLVLYNVFWLLAIPVWRDLHFYVAHRFLHIRAVYTYVHKLHHRNADPEPFSGICMHPVEHMYYYSCAFTPSIYLSGLSPLVAVFNWVHLTLAPGAGHSGFEDHFQSDQYHFLHHAKFECNYGSPMSAPIDQAIGTFREKLGASKMYSGEWSAEHDDNREALAAAAKKRDDATTAKKARVWSPNGYLGLPASWDHAAYTAFWVALFPLAVAASKGALPQWCTAAPVAAFLAYSPVAVALALSAASGDKMSWRWPFQKERVFGVFGLFLVLAWAVCVVPVYHIVLWTTA